GVGLQLDKGKVQLDPVFPRPLHNAGLGCQRVAATDTVDLERMRTAHQRQQYLVTKLLVVRKGRGDKHWAARCPAPHEGVRNRCLIADPARTSCQHIAPSLWCVSPQGYMFTRLFTILFA